MSRSIRLLSLQKGSFGNDLQGSPAEGAMAHRPERGSEFIDTDRINPQQCSQCIEDKDEIKRSLNRLGAKT